MSGAHLYRPCVGIALFNKDGLVFVGERLDTPGAWQMPQGGIDTGEDIETAAFRELQEEVGTNKAHILGFAPHPIRYDLPHPLAENLWNSQFKGQEQHWVAMRFEGADSDIQIASGDMPEFSHWKWVPLQDTVNLIVPFKREVYEQVIQLFAKYSVFGLL